MQDAGVKVVQKYLLEQLVSHKNDLYLIHCLTEAELSSGAISVSQLANDIGITQRHLSRKFQQCLGLSPKDYLRVCRLINFDFKTKPPMKVLKTSTKSRDPTPISLKQQPYNQITHAFSRKNQTRININTKPRLNYLKKERNNSTKHETT